MNKYEFQIQTLKKLFSFLDPDYIKIPVIAVAGTNGKGSVSEYINRVLINKGNKVGLYTSPHLFQFTERIKINNREIKLDKFKELLKIVRNLQKTHNLELSKFEILTAIAIIYFANDNTDINIMEVGLGGRLDATNICMNKVLSVITSISLEHMEYLGDTVEKIAQEKAGIIGNDSIVIDSSNTEKVREAAIKKNCKLLRLGVDFRINNVNKSDDGKYIYNFSSDNMKISNIKTGLRGRHQAINSAVAIAACEKLGIKDEELIKDSIAETDIPGRISVYEYQNKKVIVDVAHNPDSFYALKSYIVDWKPKISRIHLIIGGLKDKDFKKIADIIEPVVENIYIFTVDYKSRGLEKEKIAEFFTKETFLSDNYTDAFNKAIKRMNDEDWVIACGSFSVAASASKFFK